MLNIVIPMAGKGSRFLKAGFALPKPLIPVHDIPMIRLVIENIRPACKHRFVFICQHAHLEEHALEAKLMQWAGKSTEVIEVNGPTEGAACSVLGARELIDNTDPMVVAHADQFVVAAIDDFLAEADVRGLDGLMMTMRTDDPKWAFVGLDKKGFVDRVMDKQPISDQAAAGIYFVRHGRDFVRAADALVVDDIRVNGEFPLAPVYNALVDRGARIGTYDIGAAADGVYGLGMPSELEAFLEQPIARAFAAGIK